MSAINDVISSSKIVADSLKKGGLIKPSHRIEKIILMLSYISTETEDEAKKKLATKYYKNEIEFLLSAVTDVKGLKDMCPRQLNYEDWRNELSKLNAALNKLK